MFRIVLSAALALAGVSALAQSGWTIPQDAAQLTSPVGPTPDVMKRGRGVFTSRCQKCHGPDGRGDGPQSDPDNPAADLTDASAGERNPDGVLFYKVWNGRKPMPAFKSELTKDEVWAVVEYVKSLRRN